MARVSVGTLDMTREEWLKERKSGLGGSDAAAILGLNPYQSAFAVYLDKLGLSEEQPDNERMRQGRDLEQYVADRFTEQEGKRLRKSNAIHRHKKYPFLLGNYDRLVVGEQAGFEAKTTSILNKTPFDKGEIPIQHYVQCMHYMAVSGLPKWYLGILVLNSGFHVFEIERNENEIKAIIDAEVTFWQDHILQQVPPPPDGSTGCHRAIQAMYPEEEEGYEIDLFAEEQTLDRILLLKQQERQMGVDIDILQQEIMLKMGTAAIARTSNHMVSWKSHKVNSIDRKRLAADHPDIYEAYTKTISARPFKVKKIKEE